MELGKFNGYDGIFVWLGRPCSAKPRQRSTKPRSPSKDDFGILSNEYISGCLIITDTGEDHFGIDNFCFIDYI